MKIRYVPTVSNSSHSGKEQAPIQSLRYDLADRKNISCLNTVRRRC